MMSEPSASSTPQPANSSFLLRPTSHSPAKRYRNLKNLAVNTASATSFGKVISTAQFPLVSAAAAVSSNHGFPATSCAPASSVATSTTTSSYLTSERNNSSLPMPTPLLGKFTTSKPKKSNRLGLTIATPSTCEFPCRLDPSTPATAVNKPSTLGFGNLQKSPSYPLPTAKFPPLGGMSLPTVRKNRDSLMDSRIYIFQSITPAKNSRSDKLGVAFSKPPQSDETTIAAGCDSDGAWSEPNFDLPLSREQRPDAYPNGPICICEPNVDLYLEPTAEIASRYDVVINVAKEVKNPFNPTKSPPGLDENRTGLHHIKRFLSPPLSSTSKFTHRNYSLNLSTSPSTTPPPSQTCLEPPITSPNFLKSSVLRSGPLSSLKTRGLPASQDCGIHRSQSLSSRLTTSQNEDIFSASTAVNVNSQVTNAPPEYIHIPWEHNSDIVSDLKVLVRLIDQKVSSRKRVLIHCQCGVSRSASLVVAYVIYKNPHLNVADAYNVVKRRSKWIGPNMNLIMQLQEFRDACQRDEFLASS